MDKTKEVLNHPRKGSLAFRRGYTSLICVVIFGQMAMAKEKKSKRFLKGVMPACDGGMVVGGPWNGTVWPGRDGGMVVGGPMNGSVMPGSEGGMVVGGPLNGSIMPGCKGGIIVGGPLNGTYLPARP